MPGWLGQWLPILVAGVAILSALTAAARWAWKRTRRAWRKLNAVVDTLYGRAEEIDPFTGRVTVQAAPNIGERLYALEEWQAKTAHALEIIASTQAQMVASDERIETLSRAAAVHASEAEEWKSARLAEHEEMWLAIEALGGQRPG